MRSAGQLQKELFHNEALQMLDVLVAACVEGPPLNAPPTVIAPGACFIVGNSPAGEWAGRSGQLAVYTAAGWRFIQPAEGMKAMVRSSGLTAVYRNREWELGKVVGSQMIVAGVQVVGPQGSAIAEPTGEGSGDGPARTAINHILTALRQHGLIAS